MDGTTGSSTSINEYKRRLGCATAFRDKPHLTTTEMYNVALPAVAPARWLVSNRVSVNSIDHRSQTLTAEAHRQ
jgi:hypothetical protein